MAASSAESSLSLVGWRKLAAETAVACAAAAISSSAGFGTFVARPRLCKWFAGVADVVGVGAGVGAVIADAGGAVCVGLAIQQVVAFVG